MNAAAAREPVAVLRELFDRLGGAAYGEAVTQLEHALQCGAGAASGGATPTLVVAALLHDVGHLLHRDAGGALRRGIDDRHEAVGATWLGQWFPAAVTMPIALHVAAKRYLCAVDAGYAEALSPVSRATLQLQGGVMTSAEAAAFVVQPFAADAVRLRRWDEAAKVPGSPTQPLNHYLALVASCAVR